MSILGLMFTRSCLFTRICGEPHRTILNLQAQIMMKIMKTLSLVFICVFYCLQSLADEAGKNSNISQGDPYVATNNIRNVSNPAHTPSPSLWTQESRVGDTLYIDGEIQDIQWSILRDGEYKGVKRIVLNSFGGSVDGAKEFAKVIREQGLVTVIPAGGVCMSACTLLFQAGIKRQAHRSAIFIYHAPRAGKIGISKLHDRCKKNGKEYCEQAISDYVAGSTASADAFFNLFLQYDLNPELKDLFYSLPDESEEFWREDGNWFKKIDLVFTQDPSDQRIAQLYTPCVLDHSYLDEFNVVTDWFDHDPGWVTDKSVEFKNPYSPIP